ncbi:alpha/beta hydrolase [Embleya scabrispora]|uniref:Alpha/beta hydrolase n=1 Tax=Embleya scabrispora TaxID=159449 RepID=A0A1T3NQ08_9ACTN|nr:alpha/beta hydrolase [Embleya scabrispora]OPC78805.1 alpha/beta hydrolase [Embleya scabrispora]
MGESSGVVGVVEVDGVRLVHEHWGDPSAPPVVLLHALGEDAGDWDRIARRLADTWRVYVVELRGHGRSDWPGSYSLELMRDDLLGLLDALDLARVDLIGHSMGGIVAYLFAQEHPHRVRRLVLEDVSVPVPREAVAPVRPEGELGFDWDMVIAIRKQIDSPDPVWWDRLGLITAPTLVVGGGSGSHIPQERIAEWSRRLPDVRVVTIPVGHLVHAVEPHAFTEVVRSFLTAPDARRPAP